MNWFCIPVLCFSLSSGLAVAAQEGVPWPDPGPPATRDLFPLNLVALTYRPAGANPIGLGEWRFAFQVTRSNTFEFSDQIKDLLARDTSGRITVTRAEMTQAANSLPNAPLLFFFDGEIQRTELGFRYGLTPDTDLAVTLGWQSMGGGFLDGLIENFHKLGFEQNGRNAIARNQLTLAIVQNGKLIYFTQTTIRARPVDPIVAIIHRFYETANLTVSLIGRLQVPMTEIEGAYRSDWDSSAGILFEWRPTRNQAIDGGAAYLRRTINNAGGVNPFLLKDEHDGHLGWEWLGWSRVRPFLVLVYTSGLAAAEPGDKLNRSSLIHDLGVHVRLGPRTALTFSYINNITHNENTADMGFALRLAVRP